MKAKMLNSCLLCSTRIFIIMMSLFRKKPTEHPAADSGLKRCLSAFDLTLIGISAMVGGGIFVLIGITSATTAGPAVMLSFVIAGIACSFAALSYAELSTCIGGSGSAYGYAYAGLGELIAWIVGWDLLLQYAIGACAISIGWSGYFIDSLRTLGIHVPVYLTTSYFEGGFVNLFAMIIILLLSSILTLGVKNSARFNTSIVFIKLAVIALFMVTAAFNLKTSHWHPFMPFGFHGVIEGAALVFFAFLGFDAVSTAAEEAINPQRDLAVGTIATLVICTLLYILMSALLTGIAPYTELNVKSPVADSILNLGYPWIANIIAVGAVIGMTSGTLILIYGLTRVIYSMSKDGLLPGSFSKISTKTHTPVRIISVCGISLALMAGFLPLMAVAELVNLGTMAAFAMVCLITLGLRYTKPDLPRPFRTPFCPFVPLLGAASCIYLMTNLSKLAWIRFMVWMAIGTVVYFCYGYSHSKLAKKS